MIGFVVLLVFFLFGVACTCLSGWIAERRGRSVKLWCWMGAIFGPIALLAIALLRPIPTAPTGEPR